MIDIPADISISFCIISNGRKKGKLRKLIHSIRALKIPEFEIIICGQLEVLPDGVKYIKDIVSAKNGLLGKMRNQTCLAANYGLLVVIDDDISFDKDFYTELLKTPSFDVLSTKLLNPDGSRHWDWAILNNDEHRLIPYDELHEDVYISGARCILQKSVFMQVQWDEELGFYEGEDVDFSYKLKTAGYKISFNANLVITHNDWRVTQINNRVEKMGHYKVILRSLLRYLRLVKDSLEQ